MSTIPDAILLLGYSATSPELDRTIRVLEMRGSGHATEQRGLVIDKAGLRVTPLPTSVRARAERLSEF